MSYTNLLPLPVSDVGNSTDSAGNGMPTGLKEAYYYTGGFLTSIRRTDGTITVVADAPSIAGETVAYVQTFQQYASGALLSSTGWVKQ